MILLLADRAFLPNSCAMVQIRGLTAGATTKVTVTYTEPTSGKDFKATANIAAFRSVHPTIEHVQSRPDLLNSNCVKSNKRPLTVLSFGSPARLTVNKC